MGNVFGCCKPSIPTVRTDADGNTTSTKCCDDDKLNCPCRFYCCVTMKPPSKPS